MGRPVVQEPRNQLEERIIKFSMHHFVNNFNLLAFSTPPFCHEANGSQKYVSTSYDIPATFMDKAIFYHKVVHLD